MSAFSVLDDVGGRRDRAWILNMEAEMGGAGWSLTCVNLGAKRSGEGEEGGLGGRERRESEMMTCGSDDDSGLDFGSGDDPDGGENEDEVLRVETRRRTIDEFRRIAWGTRYERSPKGSRMNSKQSCQTKRIIEEAAVDRREDVYRAWDRLPSLIRPSTPENFDKECDANVLYSLRRTFFLTRL